MPLTQLQMQHAVDDLATHFNEWWNERPDWRRREHTVAIEGRVFRAVMDPMIDDILDIWNPVLYFSSDWCIKIAETGRTFQYANFSISNCGYYEFRLFLEAVKKCKTECPVGIHGYNVDLDKDDHAVTNHVSFIDLLDDRNLPIDGILTGLINKLSYEMLSATPVISLHKSSEISKLRSHDIKVHQESQLSQSLNVIESSLAIKNETFFKV